MRQRKPGARERARHRRRRGSQENRAALSEEAARLMSARRRGVRPARPGRPTTLARETAELDRKAQALDSAAAAEPRVDIGVLLHDLPTRRGRGARRARGDDQGSQPQHPWPGERARSPASPRSPPRGRDAERGSGRTAQRIYSAAMSPGSRAEAPRRPQPLDDETAKICASAVGAMSTRRRGSRPSPVKALKLQGSTTLAAIEQSRAALDKAGEDTSTPTSASSSISIGGKIEALAGHIARPGRGQPRPRHRPRQGACRARRDWRSYEQLARTGQSAEEQNAGSSSRWAPGETSGLLREMDRGQAQRAS